MKDYNDYMNNISVDEELHDKILKRLTPDPRRRGLAVLRYAGMLACAAFLMFCAWVFPKLFNAPGEGGRTDGDYNGVIYGVGNDVSSPGISQNPVTGPAASFTPNPSVLPTPTPAHISLIINEFDSFMSGSIALDRYVGHFWYNLTQNELQAIFPDIGIPLSAAAYYREDGSLLNIVAYKMSENIRRATIKLTPLNFISDVFYEYDSEPVSSDVYGVPVVAGIVDIEESEGIALYIASFKLGEIAYNIDIRDNDDGESGPARLAEIVGAIIENGAPDLSIFENPVIPEMRNDELSLEEAHLDPDYGAYLPEDVPSRFDFDSAHRFINQQSNYLSAMWTAGYDEIRWRVSEPADYDRERIAFANEPEKYDLSLYSFPLSDSVPEDLREVVESPVFLAEELTPDIVKARATYVDTDRGDTPGWRMSFTVLIGDVLVDINAKGATPEQVWEMLAGFVEE